MTNTPIKLNDEIINAIQKKYIILIVGDMGSGKTTEATEIGRILNKPVKVIINNEHKEDISLFNKEEFEKIIVSSESDNRQSLKPQLKGVKGYTIIYDDYQGVSTRNKKTIQDLSIDLRKRKLQLILIYHGEGIPKIFLKDSNSFLIIKRNSGLERYKVSQYVTKKGISQSIVDYSKDIKNYDSIYLMKNGKYFHRDGNTNSIKEDKFKSKVIVDVDEKTITDMVLASGLSQKEIAEDYGISESSVYKMVKNRKEKDEKFSELYENLKKKKVVSKKSPKGKIIKSGVSLSIEVEKLLPLGNKNMRQIAYFNNLKEIGDFAIEVIGEGISKAFEEEIKQGNVKYVEILIRKGRGGCDITIDVQEKKKKIEIEVKNIKKTPKKKHITPSTTNRDIIPRFSNQATEKHLFTCGIGCNNKSKDILQKNNIKYKRLAYKQLNKGDRDRKYHIKKIMKEFVSDILI